MTNTYELADHMKISQSTAFQDQQYLKGQAVKETTISCCGTITLAIQDIGRGNKRDNSCSLVINTRRE